MGAAALAGPASAMEDRLERFRELAAARLGLAQVLDVDDPAQAYGEIYALIDDEIVDSLAAGSVFASTAFLQERLDGFAAGWGGAVLRVTRVGPLVVGAFKLGDQPHGNSVRVYGGRRDQAALLAAVFRPGRPVVFPLPPAPDGAQFLVAWDGPASGRGTRELRLDLLRHSGDGVRMVWSTADLFGDGLMAREWRVGDGQIRIRYELRYPGWTPGCDGQTEQEDLYRLAADTGTFVRVSRRQYDAWHRDFHRAVAAVFSAVAAGDPAALAQAVPDPDLRRRLPTTLRAEPACDASAASGMVSVAAVADDRKPWNLTFAKRDARWRLVAAAPVIE